MAETTGFDQVGVTVKDLDASRSFFVDCLGWKVVGGRPSQTLERSRSHWCRAGVDPEYPAVYVADGSAVLTLWCVQDPATCVEHNRRTNVGLHHLALRVPSREVLESLHPRVAAWPGVVMEFPPQLSGSGPKVHMMLQEPGGNRLEIAWDPRK